MASLRRLAMHAPGARATPDESPAATTRLAAVSREIALITNPTSGKGRGGRAREGALGRLRESGLVVRNLAGRDADEALDLALQCVADGVEALVVCGGDGMVHLGVQAVAGSRVPPGPSNSPPPSIRPGIKFIAGEPMKPATNMLTGRS